MTTALRDCTDDTTEARELSRVAYLHIENTTVTVCSLAVL